MQPDAEKEARRWFSQAERDLDDARYNEAGGRYNWACFVAQQAAEKALKAFLIFRGEEAWGHSVAELCETAAAVDGALAALKSEAAPLDKFYILTRYPNGLPGGIPAEAFSREDALSALEMAARVIAQVRQLL